MIPNAVAQFLSQFTQASHGHGSIGRRTGRFGVRAHGGEELGEVLDKMRAHDASERTDEIAHGRHERIVIVIVGDPFADRNTGQGGVPESFFSRLARRRLGEEGVSVGQNLAGDGRQGVRAAQFNDGLNALARLADGILIVVLHEGDQFVQYRGHGGGGMTGHGIGTGDVPLLPTEVSSVMGRHARDHHGGQRLGDFALDERMPIVRGVLEDGHGFFEVRDEGRSGVGGHFSKGRDGALLGFEKGGTDV
mmetsp:Transcript_28538/g.83994  ORF Transcript_28538/g.83994 Transcript_28538/m.83994 type:complete len:249 (-) Transcript_28538:1715-2461(-)